MTGHGDLVRTSTDGGFFVVVPCVEHRECLLVVYILEYAVSPLFFWLSLFF